MKKIFAIMVSAILILCILSGCGSPNVSNPSNENTLHVANSVAEHSMETLINHADIITYAKLTHQNKHIIMQLQSKRRKAQLHGQPENHTAQRHEFLLCQH